MTTNREATINDENAATGADIPIVCTLTAEEAGEQLFEWSDLQHHAKEVVAIEAGARMKLPATMVDQVNDLIRREAGCCAFLNLDVAVEADTLTLEVTAANPDALPVIAVLAGIALQ